ncbi:DUF3927 domain-containing protein [Escherichia coli]|nr:DUF3927 family protein [Escherichia coli]KAB2550950.1 DUF3927 domain-containing protein [Escherichia coli]MDF0891562.1 DUF3927 domain-containing protein [Escherichia coli]
MTVKLRLATVALLLFLVVMVDFTCRIMSVLADSVYNPVREEQRHSNITIWWPSERKKSYY